MNVVLFPTPTVMEVGDTLTEERTGTMGVMVMVALAHFVTPFREATTVKRATPGAGPAVKVVADPVVGVMLPTVLLRDQTYATEPGHVLVQVGVAENPWVPLTVTDGDDGVTVTEVRMLVEVMMTAAIDCLEMPFNVAFTARATDPAVGPAVKVVVTPVAGLTDPRLLFKVHV